MATDHIEARVNTILSRIAAGLDDPAAARAEIFALAFERMQVLTARMIRGFPAVRRWDDTADIVQSAALRLHRSLADVELRDGRHLLRLMALQVRRELIDLTRKYSSPDSAAAHHETNSFTTAVDGDAMKSELAVDPKIESIDRMESWTRLHDAVGELPPDDREIFDLVWFLGATQKDIATLTDMSPRTVRRRWEDIKRRLLARLDGEFPSE
jgi:RNA polymerase sigma factor (sigma-70 family)